MTEAYYGLPPTVLARDMVVDLVKDKVEICSYQYLPIKMAGALENFHIPVQLDWIRRFIKYISFDPHTDFIYVSVKHLFVGSGNYQNRPGWHSDGFGSDDVNYIWSDSFPTQFCLQKFLLTEDHTLSLQELEAQALPENIVDYGANAFVRIDRWNIHRPPVEGEGFRTFLKFSVSKNMYNLQGNSHNYLMNYDWDMTPRQVTRNHPTAASANLPEAIDITAPMTMEQLLKIPAERSAAPAQVGTVSYDDREILLKEMTETIKNTTLQLPHCELTLSLKQFVRAFTLLGVSSMPVRHTYASTIDMPESEHVTVEYMLRKLIHDIHGEAYRYRGVATARLIRQLCDSGLFILASGRTVVWDSEQPDASSKHPPQKVYHRSVRHLTWSPLVHEVDAYLKERHALNNPGDTQ